MIRMEPPYYFKGEDAESRIFWKAGEYHSKLGAISADLIENAEPGDILKTHLSHAFAIIRPTPAEVVERFKRGPQAITLKDAAYLIARCGIFKESRVLEAGTGSGSLTGFLSIHAGEVVSFERRPEFAKVARDNLERLSAVHDVSNVSIFEDDLENAKDHASGPFDAAILDMPQPWERFSEVSALMAPGGWLACYVPNATQALECANAFSEAGFDQVETVELMRREWSYGGRVAKPRKDLLHTAFLCFARKVTRIPESG